MNAPRLRIGLPFAAVAAALAAVALCTGAVFLREPRSTSVRGSAASAGARTAVRAPAEWPFSDIPLPPAFEPTFSARGRDGAVLFAAGPAPGSAATAAAALRAAMEAGGWTPAPPTAACDGATLWTRGRAVALSGASPRADGSTCFLVLRRALP